MQTKLIWDEAKRMANLAKHGLDFADACDVLDSAYRLDVPVVRNGEARTQSFSYVLDLERSTRVISYRKASTQERLDYYEWIGSE
jgi:uncharacterized protein